MRIQDYNLLSGQVMLSIADLNHVIKYYAARVQQRIEELQCPAVAADPPDQQDYLFISLVAKYAHYATSDDRELRLARKLVERLLQIFDFFAAKSNSQNLLALIHARIHHELHSLLAPLPLQLGELFSYIHLLTRRGCIVKPPAEKKRVVSRPVFRDPREQRDERAPTFSFANLQKRATSAVASNRHLRATTQPPAEKWKPEDALTLWSGLDLDRAHFMRVKDTQEHILLRDALRRNEHIINLTRRQDRRLNRRAVTEVEVEEGVLMEVKTNALKGWSKKRRPALPSRKKHHSIKENVSILA